MKIPFSRTYKESSRARAIPSLFCTLALLLGVPFATYSQVVTAGVRGAVVDEQGAAIAGAEVTITNVETSFSRTATTGSDGEYNFPNLPLGLFKIRASHSGFQSTEQTGISLHANDSLVVNISLKIGAVNQFVTVEATPIAVQTTSGELSSLIQSNQVGQLPLNGRNFMELLTLVPGVAPQEAFSLTNKGLKGASDVSISGGSSNANQWLVDGANNNDTGSQRTILIYPSVDSIEEFKIERNSYGPEFGLSAGGQISIITKSGSNDFHGGVFYSGRNDALDAYDTEVKANCPAGTSCAKNKLRENNWGYNVGGPIKKNKIFFFWNQEWNRIIGAQTFSARVPTAAERTGDYTAIAACPASAANKAAGHNNIGFPIDPVTGAPALHDPAGAVGNAAFGATLPATRQIPTSISGPFMSMFPLPTNPDPCASINWSKSENLPTPWREEHVRGDVNLTKSLTLMMRYTQDSWKLGPPSGGFGWGSNALGVIDQSWEQPGRIAVGRLSKTIGSNMVNDFQFSWSQNQITIAPSNSALQQQLNNAIPYNFPISGKKYGDMGPSVWFQGATNLPSVWTIAPWANEQDLFTWQDDLSMVKNRHTFKFGVSISKNSKDEQQTNTEFGTFGGPTGFNGCSGSINAACPNSTGNTTGYNPADILLEGMTFGMSETNTIYTGHDRWHNYEFYAGDTFRLTPKLTVVYGFRWSFLPNPWLADNKYTVFNPSAYNAALGRQPCNGLLYAPGLGANPCPAGTGGMAGPNNSLWNNNNHLIAPRLSVAYDPTGAGKWAIRAGGGQFFDRDRLYTLQISGTNPPFISTFSSTNGRFLDSLTPPPACLGSTNCFSTGLGFPSIGNQLSNQVPNSWQYNLSVQRELWKDSVLEVGYVGNSGIHLLVHSDINDVGPANRVAYFENTGDAAARAALRPFGPLTLDNTITYYSRSGQSNYNALQTSFKTRFSRNSQFQFAYTWSKLISDTVLIDSPNNIVDFYNPRASRGPDYLNRPHIFVANLIYNLPSLQNQNSFVRTVAGDWEVSSILNFAKGPSVTPVVGTDFAGIGSTGGQRPNLVPGQSCQSSSNDGRQWLNPNAFTMNGLAIGQNGDAGVGICTGPGNSNVDFSLRKNFKLTERVKMQFQLDFFNLFNHPQYATSGLGSNNGNKGGITFSFNEPHRQVGNAASALYADKNGNPIYPVTAGTTGCNASTHLFDPAGTAPETMCAATVINTTYNPGSNFGLALATRENGWRQIQYGLKLTF
ncbi:MAG TPA: carboxypeptidase regulatory-like domain-containing protein [Terriglobales bacterium]|nr:carboxypeptidase regulatory-like domain-containing protein [Terriglobales bacterium]